MGLKSYPNFFLHMACVESMVLAFHVKIQGSKVRHGILDCFHMVMFMSINLDEIIDDLRHVGGRWWWRVLIVYNMVLLGQDIFGLIIANSVSKGSPFQIWCNLKPFCYGCITWMHVHFSHIFELHHGLKVCCACPCRYLDGWAL